MIHPYITKPCILSINENIVYLPEELLLKIPYFKNMYSNRFSDSLIEVSNNVMREYKIENLPVFCPEGIELFCELLYNYHRSEYYDVHDYEETRPIDSLIQLMRLCDFLGITYEIIDYYISFIFGEGIKFEFCHGTPINSIDDYEFLELKEEEKLIVSNVHYSYNNPLYCNMEKVYPGFKDRYLQITDILEKYVDFSYTPDSNNRILAGMDILWKFEISDITLEYIITGNLVNMFEKDGKFYTVICFHAHGRYNLSIKSDIKYIEISNTSCYLVDDKYIITNLNNITTFCNDLKINFEDGSNEYDFFRKIVTEMI